VFSRVVRDHAYVLFIPPSGALVEQLLQKWYNALETIGTESSDAELLFVDQQVEFHGE